MDNMAADPIIHESGAMIKGKIIEDGRIGIARLRQKETLKIHTGIATNPQ